MLAEAASSFGRLVGFMFSAILRFVSRPMPAGEHTPEDLRRERARVTGFGQGPPKDADGPDPVLNARPTATPAG